MGKIEEPSKLDAGQLKETGDLHNEFIDNWLYWGIAFRAGKEFIEEVLTQHERESDDNFATRVSEAFNFPYCQNIVSVYNHFLTEKKAIREEDESVREREDWLQFKRNCDYYGTNFDTFLSDAQKLAGAYGTAGILVDMPPGEHAKDEAYPYLSSYTPNNILDWTYERDFQTRRPVLTYLKLKESSKVYLVWTREYWQRYELDDELGEVAYYDWGINRLDEVPFVFLPNIKSTEYPYLGISDIEDASLVNAAIIRALSMGNEAMKLAGFPMLRWPMPTENQLLEDSSEDETVVVGADAVLPFDPEVTNGRPDWLETPVKETIDAILAWIDRLTEEMYRAANLSGLHESREKAQTKSGTYLRYQFQQCNSVLSKKADALVEAEKRIYYFWGKWQGIADMDSLISVSRIKEFSIDSLQVELENMISALENVMSDHFKNMMQRRIAKHTYPDLTETDLETMKNEIAKNMEKQEGEEEEPPTE